MTHQDNEKERRRLAELYSAMTDGELVNIAGDAESLTEVARLAVEEEIRRRANLGGMNIDDQAPPATVDVAEYQNTVTVRKFRDLHEAWMAKGSLDSAGIKCWLADDNMVRMDWFISNFLGGVKLRVKPEDVDAAEEVLDQAIPEDFDVGEPEDS
ncbi:MAG TPA: DUF2007 domain-containing protein [Nitrososphaera sp.]|nr:DUF2007 domain-containing protein [Nitrososphaera sp.]